MSEILTGIALTRMKLGSHAEMLLIQNGYLTRIPKEKKGDRAKFNILKPLPSLEEIQAIRVKQFTATIGDLVEDAFSEFESLAGELSEWYDNLPEGFQQGDKGSAIEEAKDSLENISQPNV